MLPQFKDESLTETHHFGIGLSFRREVGTAFAAAHGKRCQRIFECLFKGKELQDG
ncbi:hypothetical protein Barb7_01451 [Bacteroidales bacterium Barb7]|nr:hypothetical protein Barb7_01451 [Bacteroidales bacterium Barb7]